MKPKHNPNLPYQKSASSFLKCGNEVYVSTAPWSEESIQAVLWECEVGKSNTEVAAAKQLRHRGDVSVFEGVSSQAKPLGATG